MKYFFTFLVSAFLSLSVLSQVPQLFNYQAVFRDANGETLDNSNVTLKFTIQESETAGAPVKYQETQSLVTNEFGLINCLVGNGLVVFGSMTDVDWNAGTRWLKVEVNTGNGFVDTGTHQLVSVPYANVAQSALDVVNGWSTNGNANLSGLNFIGTTSDSPLRFKVNNVSSGLLDANNENVFLGAGSGLNTTGILNTFVGNNAALNNEDGSGNTVLGCNAMAMETSGVSNVAVGHEAMLGGGFRSVAIGAFSGYDGNSTDSQSNVFVGFSAGFSNRFGDQCVMIGHEAGFNNGYFDGFQPSGGNRNVFIGYQSGYNNIGSDEFADGEDNTFVGFKSGFNNEGVGFGGSRNCFLGSSAGYSNSDGNNNVFIGTKAGFSNLYGDNNTFMGTFAGYQNTSASFNTFIGSSSGEDNIGGTNNTFIGALAGNENIGGSYNTFIGKQAGTTNEGGASNTFVGAECGFNNTEGIENTFMGFDAGLANGIGDMNTFFGSQAGMDNSTGSENTFIGRNAGVNNSTANHNTAIGFDAGGSQTTGGDCTFLGYSAEASAGTHTNATAIGYQASVTASNRVRIGNTTITQIGGQVAWSSLSDARLKKNIVASELGLDFILKLKPVKYNFIEGHEGILYTGFIAQDVEKILVGLDEEFSGITKPENETDYYSIRYAEFVMPLVNAVQELNKKIETLELNLANAEKMNIQLESELSMEEQNELALKEQMDQIQLLKELIARQQVQIDQLLQP